MAEDHVVLDHGCGWGKLTCHLAPRVGRVVAMDLVRNRAQFTALRSRQDGSDNVVPVVSGDYERLPFPADCFDAALLNGVLEWVPSVLPGDPGAVQEARLRELARVLKPGGQLLLAIENRYWWRYFLGTPEVHTGIRWAALAPRWATGLLARMSGRPAFRTYTYSLNGYHRLLRRAGFEEIAAYITAPEYNFTEVAMPIGATPALSDLLIGRDHRGLRSLLSRLGRGLGIRPHVAYCYAFVCQKR